MRKLFKTKLITNEDGQSLILVALLMGVLLGFAALVVDLGRIYVAKADLQKAADAASLAGVMDLNNIPTAYQTAIDYAGKNNNYVLTTEPVSPYEGDDKKLKVTCKSSVPNTFARIWGDNETEISAMAVAKVYYRWNGDALPFINLDDNYSENSAIEIWEKTSPGDFESIDKDEYVYDPVNKFFKVNYEDGIEVKKGVVATIKDEIQAIYDMHKIVYVLSLSSDVIASGKVRLINGTYRDLEDFKKNDPIKNNDVIDPSQLVLLECTFDAYKFEGGGIDGEHRVALTVLNEYKISEDEYPPDYLSPDGSCAKSKLVK